MIDLIKARPHDRAKDFPGSLDLREMLAIPRIQAGTRLWTDPLGHLVCYVILDGDRNSASMIFEIAPGWRGETLDMRIFDWVETHILQTSADLAGPFQLETSVSSDNHDRIAYLERHGFERQAGGACRLERSLADPIPTPLLPDGFIFRPINSESEAEDWVRLHRAALGTENMTTEYKLAMMRTPYYDPEMDLVAVAPDGRLAAYCVCFINVEENALTGQRNGCTDPIATHPDFQRRGLARALMLTGLAMLKDRGMEAAQLGTDSQNIAMLGAARSAGFHIIENVFRYCKLIRQGKKEGGK